jgi:hypothetical protein
MKDPDMILLSDSPAGNSGRSELITLEDLAEAGLTPADVRHRCPWAVERVALDGSPCWEAEYLRPLLDGRLP